MRLRRFITMVIIIGDLKSILKINKRQNWNFSLFVLTLYKYGGKHFKEEKFQP